MNTEQNQQAAEQNAAQPQDGGLDLDSDEPLVCGLRPAGLGEGEICEACQ